jgi:PEP-CTERM motif
MRARLIPALLLASAASGPAIAAVPIYPTPGTENPVPYTITAASGGNIIAYFLNNTGAFTNLLGLRVNGVDRGILGLNNQTSTPGDMLDFGAVNAGDQLVFFIDVNSGSYTWFSDKSLNTDGVNHVWSTPWSDGDFGIPAGQYMNFEDLEGGGDFNYGDLGFVFTNVRVAAAVPEPATWAMLILGFGVIGATMRRRSNVRTRVSFV